MYTSSTPCVVEKLVTSASNVEAHPHTSENTCEETDAEEYDVNDPAMPMAPSTDPTMLPAGLTLSWSVPLSCSG